MTGPAMRLTKNSLCVFVLLLQSVLISQAWAQWTNRYPKQEGFNHHIYVEGYDMPVMGAGPSDPAASPDGRSLAFAAHGWLWLLNLESGHARRLTSGARMDSRPAWSPDGKKLAFVRDDSKDTDLFVLDLPTGQESPVVQTESIDLDPAYSPDGKQLYYSSGIDGNLDIWRLDIGSGQSAAVVSSSDRLEMRPQAIFGTSRLVYISKPRFGFDQMVVLDLSGGEPTVLKQQAIVSQLRPGISPDGRSLVYNWTEKEDYDLFLLDLAGGEQIRLTQQGGLPLAPVFSADGKSIYFFEANEHQQFELFRLPTTGGAAEKLAINHWDWGQETGQLVIATTVDGSKKNVPARVRVVDHAGHPLLSSHEMARFDSYSGKVYQSSPGSLKLVVPAGKARIEAAHGLASPVVNDTALVEAGRSTVVKLTFKPLWNPRDEGWYSGDLHYHMNYGGPFLTGPEQAIEQLRAEDLDIGTPMAANLHHRLSDPGFLGWRPEEPGDPVLLFGQEVRSHFHGHVGLTFIDQPFWPWFWGPNYPVYTWDDRTNEDPLAFARRNQGIGTYMHPLGVAEDPFGREEALGGIPLNIIPDAVLGDLDAIELACLYTHEMFVSELWYRLLNVGAPIAASAGTDSFVNYYRSFAAGTTRLYARLDDEFSADKYKSALKAGRSFVSTGPLLDFSLADARPGDVVSTANGNRLQWSLMLASAMPVEKVEIVVNGEIVETREGLDAAGRRTYQGEITLPEGGWVAGRAHGGEMQWPGMNPIVFAHSSPIWINSVASTNPDSAAGAAVDLLRAMDNIDTRLAERYGDQDIPKIRARFAAAREHLESIVGQHQAP